VIEDKGRLVLTRKLNQEIVISRDGEEILRLKVYDIKKNAVRLSFQAQDDLQIDRLERFLENQ